MHTKGIHSPPHTLESLYAEDPTHSCLHNDIIYTNAVKWAIGTGGTLYLALPIDADRPREILGSIVVIPVTPGPFDVL